MSELSDRFNEVVRQRLGVVPDWRLLLVEQFLTEGDFDTGNRATLGMQHTFAPPTKAHLNEVSRQFAEKTGLTPSSDYVMVSPPGIIFRRPEPA